MPLRMRNMTIALYIQPEIQAGTLCTSIAAHSWSNIGEGFMVVKNELDTPVYNYYSPSRYLC